MLPVQLQERLNTEDEGEVIASLGSASYDITRSRLGWLIIGGLPVIVFLG